jgi:hypothetical protein
MFVFNNLKKLLMGQSAGHARLARADATRVGSGGPGPVDTVKTTFFNGLHMIYSYVWIVNLG